MRMNNADENFMHAKFVFLLLRYKQTAVSD